MQNLEVVLDGEGAWPDLVELMESGDAYWFRDVAGEPQAKLTIAALEDGMESGLTSLAFRVDLPSLDGVTPGITFVIESSLRLWQAAIGAFTARYGEQ